VTRSQTSNSMRPQSPFSNRNIYQPREITSTSLANSIYKTLKSTENNFQPRPTILLAQVPPSATAAGIDAETRSQSNLERSPNSNSPVPEISVINAVITFSSALLKSQ
jgi:hypothetical protein